MSPHADLDKRDILILPMISSLIVPVYAKDPETYLMEILKFRIRIDNISHFYKRKRVHRLQEVINFLFCQLGILHSRWLR